MGILFYSPIFQPSTLYTLKGSESGVDFLGGTFLGQIVFEMEKNHTNYWLNNHLTWLSNAGSTDPASFLMEQFCLSCVPRASGYHRSLEIPLLHWSRDPVGAGVKTKHSMYLWQDPLLFLSPHSWLIPGVTFSLSRKQWADLSGWREG